MVFREWVLPDAPVGGGDTTVTHEATHRNHAFADRFRFPNTPAAGAATGSSNDDGLTGMSMGTVPTILSLSTAIRSRFAKPQSWSLALAPAVTRLVRRGGHHRGMLGDRTLDARVSMAGLAPRVGAALLVSLALGCHATPGEPAAPLGSAGPSRSVAARTEEPAPAVPAPQRPWPPPEEEVPNIRVPLVVVASKPQPCASPRARAVVASSADRQCIRFAAEENKLYRVLLSPTAGEAGAGEPRPHYHLCIETVRAEELPARRLALDLPPVLDLAIPLEALPGGRPVALDDTPAYEPRGDGIPLDCERAKVFPVVHLEAGAALPTRTTRAAPAVSGASPSPPPRAAPH
jgi:hypothetical protein